MVMVMMIKRAARSMPRGIVLLGSTLTTLPVTSTSRKKPNVIITISIINKELTNDARNPVTAILNLFSRLSKSFFSGIYG